MIRTQIYLPEDTHANLLRIAKESNTSLSKLIRKGAEIVIKKKYGKNMPQQKALKFFANPPGNLIINKSGKELIELIRKERDEE